MGYAGPGQSTEPSLAAGQRHHACLCGLRPTWGCSPGTAHGLAPAGDRDRLERAPHGPGQAGSARLGLESSGWSGVLPCPRQKAKLGTDGTGAGAESHTGSGKQHFQPAATYPVLRGTNPAFGSTAVCHSGSTATEC